jgi:gamma-glutamyltranspeptidase/glutathione hydrolase
LQKYRVPERKPVVSAYRGMTIGSAALPSSSGAIMAEMFNQLAQFDLPAMSKLDRDHAIIEAMRRAYRDRAEYLGDADFVTALLERLTSLEYAQSLVKDINIESAGVSNQTADITLWRGSFLLRQHAGGGLG